MTAKTCKTCENEFTPTRKKQVYCSVVCQNKALRKRSVSACQNDNCDKSFEHKPSEKRKYCSRSCSAQMTNKTSPKRKPEGTCKKCNKELLKSHIYCKNCHAEGGLYEKTCLECSKEYSSRWSTSRYCSNECKRTSSQKRMKTYKRVKYTCPQCLTPESRSYSAKYCLDCSIAVKTQNRIESWLSGEWDGASGQYLSTTIRRYLLEQVGFACEQCGFDTPHPSDGSSVLEVDHIDGDGENHRPENLRVLCPNCHALTPTYRARNMGKGRKQYYLRMNASSVKERM